jgi:hypothetical protein
MCIPELGPVALVSAGSDEPALSMRGCRVERFPDGGDFLLQRRRVRQRWVQNGNHPSYQAVVMYNKQWP